MSTIEVAVAGRGIQVKQGYEKPSAGDVNTCEVSLAIESGGVWDSLPHKRVTFATRTASVTVDYAPTIAIPHEVMASPGALYLTLTGYDADGIEVARTHRMTYPIEVARAGADEGAEPSPATLDVVSRIDALAADLEEKRDTDYWRGEQGPKGEPGPQGVPGPQGAPGAPGSDANVTKENVEAALGYEPLNAAYANNIYIMQKQIENLQGIAATEETDSTEAYTKTVPTGAQKWASLDKVGGKTVVNDGELVSAEVVEVESRGKNLAIVDTFLIPAEVRDMCPGYGWSAGSVCNEIDFGRKMYVQRVGSVDLSTLNLSKGNASNIDEGYFGYYLKVSDSFPQMKPSANVVCKRFFYHPQTIIWEDMPADSFFSNAYLHFQAKYDTIQDFKAAMQGVLLYYELAEPVEVDLSDVLPDDHFIEVEAGGTITFKQAETQLPVPSSVTYQISTKEAIANA